MTAVGAEGLEEGLLKAIELGLELKFGSSGLALMPEVRQRQDLAILFAILDAIKSAGSVDDIHRLLSRR